MSCQPPAPIGDTQLSEATFSGPTQRWTVCRAGCRVRHFVDTRRVHSHPETSGRAARVAEAARGPKCPSVLQPKLDRARTKALQPSVIDRYGTSR